jgi:hypothetical protein
MAGGDPCACDHQTSHIDGHCLLRGDELRRWIAFADAQIVAQRRWASARTRHRETRAIAFNLAGRITGRTRYVIAFVYDVPTTK